MCLIKKKRAMENAVSQEGAVRAERWEMHI